jgi:homocysteine S-methyltransferase
MRKRICRAGEFRQRLGRRALVAGGAMGTVLYSKGVLINRCYDELNLTSPSLVGDSHKDYVRNGAEILESNTFGANRLRLANFGIANKTAENNRAGVHLAPEAAGWPASAPRSARRLRSKRSSS